MLRILLSIVPLLLVFSVLAQQDSGVNIDSMERIYLEQAPFMDVFIAADQELIVIQWKNLNTENVVLRLQDKNKSVVDTTVLRAGTTIAYFDTRKLYVGRYDVCASEAKKLFCKAITLEK